MQPERRQLILGAAAAAGLATPIACWSQAVRATVSAWPTKPVKMIVPNLPGGGIDILARLMEAPLAKLWGQPVVIDYKAGAGTVIGTDFVAKSPPDGYTIGMVVTSHVINPSLRKQMPFDTQKDLAGLGMTATSGLLLSASPKLSINTLQELVAYAKANPGKLSYATPGAGSSMHLAGELIKLTAGIDMLHVPYRGSAGAYGDVYDDRVNLLIDPTFSSMPHVKAGRLKPIAVLSARREPTSPTIPAAGEVFKDFDVQSINGMVVPAATPRDLVERISGDLAKVLKAPDMVERLHAIGMEPVASSPESFDNFVRTEMKRWEGVVKAGNITIE